MSLTDLIIKVTQGNKDNFRANSSKVLIELP